MEIRIETDTMGTVLVPKNSYFGAQTKRAIDNFPISGITFPKPFIRSLALIKKSAASVNSKLKILDTIVSESIIRAAGEVLEGKFDDQFIVDIFQTGSGTSVNMNMNEVIASRANELITGKIGGKTPVHPNDHVNAGQSSNDIIPSAIHIAAVQLIKIELIPSLEKLLIKLIEKSLEFKEVRKIGRTHLQDALPITFGQEFSGYARQIELGIDRIRDAVKRLSELAIGGTAVGNGVNSRPDFAPHVIWLISEYTNIPFREALNHFEAQAAQDAVVETSGALKTIAVSLVKIANDIRWLSSGPRCGLGEINIPSLQPGSSIMPGKVNPVIPEAVIQVAAQVIGNDTTIMFAGQSGSFELNTMLPVIGYNLLQSIQILTSVIEVFADKCIAGITVNTDISKSNIEKSLAMATVLVPFIGYDKAASIANKAFETGKTVKEIVKEDSINLPNDEILDDLF